MARSGLRELEHLVNAYSRFQQQNLTIHQFTSFGKTCSLAESFRFLKDELPIRLAHIMKEIHHLPSSLRRTPSVSIVNKWYEESFKDMMRFRDANESEKTLENFMKDLNTIKNRHSDVVKTMAQGIVELRQLEGEKAFDPAVQYFLDRFYMNRAGIRMLINQHLALFEPELTKSSKSRFIGLFDPHLNVQEVVCDAVENASDLCDHYYFQAPRVKISTLNALDGSNNVHFAYIPSHLHQIIFELVKNAMRATVETHENKPELPLIDILIVQAANDLTVRLSDEGGGIPRSEMEKLFLYHYSTASEPDQNEGMATFAGYGYGLPLSRVYARYFGGDLTVASVEGFGTQAFVYLKTVAADALEGTSSYSSSVAKKYIGLTT